jgi:hypothetical protein
MGRFFLIAGVVVLGWFNYVQYRGWSLFSEETNATASRSANAARAFHK